MPSPPPLPPIRLVK
nr:hypothetical protein L203_00227 [Cryptococcus depauperatus CBS 7841]